MVPSALCVTELLFLGQRFLGPERSHWKWQPDCECTVTWVKRTALVGNFLPRLTHFNYCIPSTPSVCTVGSTCATGVIYCQTFTLFKFKCSRGGEKKRWGGRKNVKKDEYRDNKHFKLWLRQRENDPFFKFRRKSKRELNLIFRTSADGNSCNMWCDSENKESYQQQHTGRCLRITKLVYGFIFIGLFSFKLTDWLALWLTSSYGVSS